MFERIKQFIGHSKNTTTSLPSSGSELTYLSQGFSNLTAGNLFGSYDNTYAAVARIAEAIAEVVPIALNENEEEIDTPLIGVLAHPNKEMCGPDFMETLATLLLVHPKVYLRLWWRSEDSPHTEDNLIGLTFLENVAEMVIDGHSTYRCGGREYSEDEVITLSLAVNPYRLADGYSPSIAAKKWATVDDYIAEFQAAQFRNGAVPAGQFVITAPTVEQFENITKNMEDHFRGAHNSGNILYVHRPTSELTGKPEVAQVEWIPFAQTNKELTLDAVYNQANTKIDAIFGVPEEIKGHLSNSTYASAEVADYVFSRRVVYPKLIKIYAKLTHEFNRIFHGLGYALSFNYELPMLTDTRKLQAEALEILVAAGFTTESAVEALRLPESFYTLKKEQV